MNFEEGRREASERASERPGVPDEFGSKGSYTDLHTDSGVQRVPLRVKSKTFGLTIWKTDAWKNSNPAPAAQEAEAAPKPEETSPRRQLGQPIGEGGLSSGSNVEDMRNLLRALGGPVWGTKARVWPRLVHAEARRELQKRDQAWLEDRSQKQEARAPNEPSAEEPARHEGREVEKGRAEPHLQRPVESVMKVPEFEMDFCYLLQDSMRRHQHCDQAWATTLVTVDVSNTDDLSAMCAAFVKRMAYAKAVLKV